MRRRAKLPIGDTLLTNDGQEASLRFVCARCGGTFKSYVAIQEDGSCVEGRCTCGLHVRVQASIEEPAIGGAPGSGKKGG